MAQMKMVIQSQTDKDKKNLVKRIVGGTDMFQEHHPYDILCYKSIIAPFKE